MKFLKGKVQLTAESGLESDTAKRFVPFVIMIRAFRVQKRNRVLQKISAFVSDWTLQAKREKKKPFPPIFCFFNKNILKKKKKESWLEPLDQVGNELLIGTFGLGSHYSISRGSLFRLGTLPSVCGLFYFLFIFL